MERCITLAAVTLAAMLCNGAAGAQEPRPAPLKLMAATNPGEISPANGLPDAPAAASSLSGENEPDAGDPASYREHAIPAIAPPFQKYIAPGQVAPPMLARHKFILGARDLVSVYTVTGWVAAAGYEQIVNGSPNYGTNGGALAQRFGAAVARASSEEMFSDSFAATAFRQDPRYYRLGPGHNFAVRIGYAVTRPLLGRTDSGRPTPNFALLTGNLAGAFLTKAYYPPNNTSTTEVLKTFGGSLGGSAMAFTLGEFFDGTFSLLHGFHKPAK